MKFEIRSTPKGKTVSGYAARYGVLSNMLNGFRERIQRGAFDAVLRTSPDVVATFNHDVNKVLGRTPKTLRLSSDAAGLRFECDLPNTTYAADLEESLKRGDMNGCSFAFGKLEADDQDFAEEQVDEGNVMVRTIRNFRSLLDVSIVTTPAYPGTSVALRSLDESRGLERHFYSRSDSDEKLRLSEIRTRLILAQLTPGGMNEMIRDRFSFNEIAEYERRVLRGRRDTLSLLL